MSSLSALVRLEAVPELRDKARKLLWAAYVVCGVLLATYLVTVLARPNGTYWTWLDGWGIDAFEVLVSSLCIARGLLKRPGRAVALFLGLGLLAWSVGDIFLTIESLGGATPPNPSLADAFYLLFYPATYVAVVLLMRREIKRISPPSWLDGIIAGLGSAAICAAFAFHSIEHSAGGSALGVATNLAYPIGDVLLLGLIVAATSLLSGRGKGPWALMATGIALNVAGDTSNLFGSSFGGGRVGSTFNAIAWPSAILLISMSVWLRSRSTTPLVAERTSGFLLPGIATAAGLGLLLVATFHPIGRVAIGFATATLIVAGLRLMLSAIGLRKITEQRHREAVTDELTGLGNRRKLLNVFESLFEAPASAPSPSQSVAFLFVDLDHFKEINDSFGHSAGDQLLRQLGPRLNSVVRGSDVVVRFGGDEFAVVLIGADVDEARRVAERLTESIEEPFALDMVRARISASIGISILQTDAYDSAGLLRCADLAMFRAKAANASFAFYDQSLDDDNVLRMAEELRAAVDQKQFVIHYQPQLDLRTGEISAVEALLRWPNERLGMVPPLKFLPVAEEAGLMPSLTALVLDGALEQCAMWHADSHEVAVSVNLSASNLLDPGFTELVSELLARHNVPPSALVLEITETCIISDYERSKKVIEDLRDLGLVISIDDFGAGFTSLAYLGDLAVGELKLDRIFITGLASENRSRDLALIRSTIELGHALRLRVVAEGIEDAATLSLLAEMGCDIAQGYFISMPMSADKLVLKPTVGPKVKRALVG
jgi:diguanylate cyclase (GGDEF)-like protein